MNVFKSLVIISILGMFFMPQYSESAISCSVVIQDLQPCVSYLTSGSGQPPDSCCKGVQNLEAATTTSADKKAACQCIKSVANSVSVKPELAKALASNCGASLPVDASSTIDCNTREESQLDCQCIKSVANSVTVKPELAKALASNCGASLPVDASSTIDCNTEESQLDCQCIKSVANSVTVKPELAKALASNCGASLPVDASSTIDCNTVG